MQTSEQILAYVQHEIRRLETLREKVYPECQLYVDGKRIMAVLIEDFILNGNDIDISHAPEGTCNTPGL
jgi:hypothetical protein